MITCSVNSDIWFHYAPAETIQYLHTLFTLDPFQYYTQIYAFSNKFSPPRGFSKRTLYAFLIFPACYMTRPAFSPTFLTLSNNNITVNINVRCEADHCVQTELQSLKQTFCFVTLFNNATSTVFSYFGSKGRKYWTTLIYIS